MNKQNNDLVLVFIVNHMHFGGCQKIVYDLLEGLYDKFKAVYLIANKGYYSDQLTKKTSIKYIDRTHISPLGVVKQLKTIQKKHSRLILHTHNRIDIFYKYALRKSDNQIHTFHSAYLNKNYLYKLIKPQKAISISKTVKNYLNKYGIDNHLIYNGVRLNVDKYQGQGSTEKFNSSKVLYIGRLSKDKGFDNLLKALLSYSNKYNELTFGVIGEGKDMSYYKSLVLNSNSKLKVNFKGFLPDPWSNIDDYDLLIIPSYFEGFCLVAVEGASVGIPIIGNNILALKEVLDFLPASNFFDVNDEKSIQKTLFNCLNGMLNQKELAFENVDNIRSKFSKEKMLINYLEVYASFE